MSTASNLNYAAAMNQQTQNPPNRNSHRRRIIVASAVLGLAAATGCQDGPLYALKHVNPYFTMRDWKADRELGVTDHERREELASLVESIHSQSVEKQQYWVGELTKIMEYDPSAEMRRLAIAAAGNAKDAAAIALIETGLDDEDLKVRMEACRSLGQRGDVEAARVLAATLGSESDEDVRKSAIAALGNFTDQVAVTALSNALRNRDPAARLLAMDSLRLATGKDYGDQPADWIAALTPTTNDGEGETKIAETPRSLF